MTYGHIKPLLEVHGAPAPRPKHKAPEPLPGAHFEKAPKSRYSDEEVIAVVLANLRGESFVRLAARLHLDDGTVRAWCEGRVRWKCQQEAERRYRAEVRVRA